MSLATVSIVVYVAVALIAAAVILAVRDLRARGRAAEAEQLEATEGRLDIATLLPPVEQAEAEERTQSWLGRVIAEGASGFTEETAMLLAIAIGLALGGSLYLWRDDWLAGAAGAVMGVLVVGALLFYLRFRRQRAILDQLPEVMELMARAVRAGESLDQAIALAGDSALQPVAAEFRYCAGQMNMGLSLEAAMRGLVVRAPLMETRILAMTLVVQRRRGGSLPSTLERLARVFRDRGNFRRQFRAATAMGRGSAMLIALVALGLDVVVIFGQTEYAATLLTTNAGRIMLAASLLLQVLGVIWIAWLFRSEY